MQTDSSSVPNDLAEGRDAVRLPRDTRTNRATIVLAGALAAAILWLLTTG
jgi:hypothetical protein